MGKQDRFFAEVAKYKERFRKLPTDTIRQRLNDWADTLQKEAAIALRELLAEREQEPPPSAAKS